ncbi:MAG: hypothetical protein SWY16_11555 [Cyanobacteriota bacterium]|nr:hypothetical protein [Cyanobacteriota bacterium]
MRSLVASPNGIETAKIALTGEQWTQEKLAEHVEVDRQTVNKFFNQKPVKSQIFVEICNTLGLNWQEIAVATTSKRQPTQPAPSGNTNPFTDGTPAPPDRFYGRRDAILEVKSRIGGISPQCINIVGHRRVGKTSLLRYIRDRTIEFCPESQQPLIVSLDLQDNKFHTPEGILEGLRRGIGKLTGTEPWQRQEDDDGFAVEDGLQAIADDGYRAIVMLDEFEAIARRLVEFEDWGEDWRSKASAGLLTMVIASKRPLAELYQTLHLTSPFDNIFSTTILGALATEDWQRLVRDGFGGEVGTSELAWIDELAGGIPFYVQMAASMLWQYGDLAKAEAEFVFQSRSHFQKLWQELREPERIAIKRVIRGETVESKVMLNLLQRYGILREDSRLFSRVFAEFVAEECR